MVHGHVLQERRHQYCAGARSQAHTHGAGRTLAQLAPPVTQLVGFSHQGARPSQHLAAEGCEFAVAADAVEQGYAQLLLQRSEEHTSELQSPCNLVCRLLLEKKKKTNHHTSRASTNIYY